MADYDKQYQLLSAPEARNDGSGMVGHDIQAVYRLAGSQDAWQPVPGRHATINVPGADLQAVIDMQNGAPKVAAYKDLIVTNRATQPVPVTGWTDAELEELLDANDVASGAASGADEYITVDLGQSYPIGFNI